ncbi:MAG: PAS domain-containing protein, partial [Geminicoccaceae bacterium]
AEQPVLIADPAGRVLLTNPAFDRLTETGEAKLRWIDDLPPLFASPAEMRRILAELFEHRRVWRGEVGLATSGEPRPLMLRADPVFSAPDLVLGFVLLFTDLTGRRAAEAARRQFQEDIVDRHRVATVPLDSRADLIFRNLLSSVVGNAQLAALEITDGFEIAQVPAMLDSVQSSVERAAALLERLVWHAAGSTSKT